MFISITLVPKAFVLEDFSLNDVNLHFSDATPIQIKKE